jgi:hypothetical protein
MTAAMAEARALPDAPVSRNVNRPFYGRNAIAPVFNEGSEKNFDLNIIFNQFHCWIAITLHLK